MKKALAVFLALCMVLAMSACSKEEDNSNSIIFKNETGATIDSFYISPETDEEWGEALNSDKIAAGDVLKSDAATVIKSDVTMYDIGAIDENGLNYDVYQVPLVAGDTIVLSVDGEEAVATVTSISGSSEEYRGYTYTD